MKNLLFEESGNATEILFCLTCPRDVCHELHPVVGDNDIVLDAHAPKADHPRDLFGVHVLGPDERGARLRDEKVGARQTSDIKTGMKEKDGLRGAAKKQGA